MYKYQVPGQKSKNYSLFEAVRNINCKLAAWYIWLPPPNKIYSPSLSPINGKAQHHLESKIVQKLLKQVLLRSCQHSSCKCLQVQSRIKVDVSVVFDGRANLKLGSCASFPAGTTSGLRDEIGFKIMAIVCWIYFDIVLCILCIERLFQICRFL